MAEQEQTITIQGDPAEVTALRRQVAALEATAARWQALLQATSDRLLVIDAGGRFDELVSPAQPAAPVDFQTWVGRTLEALFPPLSAEALRTALHRVLETRTPETVEHGVSGTAEAPVRFTAQLIPLTESRVLWVAREAAESQGAHQELRQAYRDLERRAEARSAELAQQVAERTRVEVALQESESKYRLLLNSIQSPVLALTREMVVLYSNEAYARLLGSTPEQMEGQPLGEIFPEVLHSQSYALYQQVLEREESGRIEGWLGSRYLSANVYATAWGLLTVADDITDRQLAEQEQSRLLEELQRQTLLLQTAAEVSRAATSILSLDELLPQVVELLRDRFDMYYAGLFLIDGDEPWAVLRAGTGEAGKEMLAAGHRLSLSGNSMVGAAIRDRQAQISLQASRDTSLFENPYLPETRSKVALPLICRGRVIGAMTIQSKRAQAFSEADITVLQTMADQLANAIENVRLLQATQTSLVRTELLYQAVHATTTASREGLLPVLQTIADGAVRVLAADRVMLVTCDVARQQVTHTVSAGPGHERIVPLDFGELSEGLSGWVIRERMPALSPKGVPDPRESLPVQQRRAETAGGAVMVAPLIYGEEILGTLTAINPVEQPDFTAQDLELLQMLANQAAVTVENARLLEQTQARATELNILNEMARRLTLTLDPAAVAQQIYESAGQLMDTTNFYLALYDAEAEEIQFVLDMADGAPVQRSDGYRRRMGQGLTEIVIRSRKPLLISRDMDRRRAELKLRKPKQGAQSWLGVPVMVGERVIGVLTVQSYTTPGLYTERECALLTAIASQAAIAIENARLFRDRDQRIVELSVLNEIGRTLTPSLSLDEMIETIQELIGRLFNLSSFYIALYEEGQDFWSIPLRVEHGVRQERTEHRFGEGVTSYILAKRKPLLLRTQQEMRNFAIAEGLPLIGELARSWMGVPMMSGRRVLGVMAVQDYEVENRYGEHDIVVFSTIANQIAVSLENARLFAQAQAERQRLARLYETGRLLSAASTLDEVIRVTLQSAAHVEAAYTEILLFDFGGRPLLRSSIPERAAFSPEEAQAFIGRVLAEGLERWVIERREVAVVSDTRQDSRWLVLAGHEETDPVRSLICAPLFDRQGKIIGVLSYCHPEPNRFGAGERQWVAELSGRLATALESARLLTQAQDRARREQLLGELTARVRNSVDPEAIVRTAVQGLGTALGRPTFIRLGDKEQLDQPPAGNPQSKP